jgi:hypothetical protein
MKIIVLDSTAKSIKAVLASSVATSNPDFVVAYADTSDNTFSELSSDGQLNGTTDVTLVAAPASGVKRTIKSISVYNRDTAPVIVVIKLDVSGTQRILQRVQLVSGETWHSDDLSKLGPGGSDTQVQFNDVGTLAGSSNFTYNKTTSVLTLGANPVLTAGTANGVLYLNASKVATSGSVLTFDGAQLGVNGITLGRGAGAVATNTAVGASALAANTTGARNTVIGAAAGVTMSTADSVTAVGYGALNANTGSGNTGIGEYALQANSSGANNTSLGFRSLYSNTTANSNTAVGYQAGYSNTTGAEITALGYQAGYGNTTGNYNAFVGAYAGKANTTGTQNAAFGYQSMSLATGSYNTAIGLNSLQNASGSYNTAIGNSALNANTTASENTAVGYQAGYSNTTGAGVVAIGWGAGYTNTTGSYNTYVGTAAGRLNSTSSGNTFVGIWAGYNTTGGGNTFIGCDTGGFGAGYLVTTGTKNTILGAYNGNEGGLDIRTLNNYIVLSDGDGNPRIVVDNNAVVSFDYFSTANAGTRILGPSTTGGPRIQVGHASGTVSGNGYADFLFAGSVIGTISQNGTTAVAYNTSSDYRLKEEIQPMTGALAKVAALKPCTYKWKSDGSDGEGFIAHELAEVCPQAVTGEKDAVDEDGNPKYQGVDTSFLVATLTAAIQELKSELDSVKAELATLKGN